LFSLRIALNNVSLRAFLFLLDQKNRKTELSNTTICDYILENYKDWFSSQYKDFRSFRSGYAGNLSLIFDSAMSQEGRSNRFQKKKEELLDQVFRDEVILLVRFEDNYCFISRIQKETSFQILSIFFNLKQINAAINRSINLKNPRSGWGRPLINNQIAGEDFFTPMSQLNTGRGDKGRKAILNRYTVYNYSGIWMDILKPGYYDFQDVRYKILLKSLQVEQENYFFAIPLIQGFPDNLNDFFKRYIRFKEDQPLPDHPLLEHDTSVSRTLLIHGKELMEKVKTLQARKYDFQYYFKIKQNRMIFEEGFFIDLDDFTMPDAGLLNREASLNPNLTFSEDLFSRNASLLSKKADLHASMHNRMDKVFSGGEESETVRKFLEASLEGRLKIEYEEGQVKTGIILYNGTRYPDMICVFLEDLPAVLQKGGVRNAAVKIRQQYMRYQHLFWEAEVEYDSVSFASHDKSAEMVKRSRFIFCEKSDSSGYYISHYGIKVPVVTLGDLKA